jgi:hypothetical protein
MSSKDTRISEKGQNIRILMLIPHLQPCSVSSARACAWGAWITPHWSTLMIILAVTAVSKVISELESVPIDSTFLPAV